MVGLGVLLLLTTLLRCRGSDIVEGVVRYKDAANPINLSGVEVCFVRADNADSPTYSGFCNQQGAFSLLRNRNYGPGAYPFIADSSDRLVAPGNYKVVLLPPPLRHSLT